MNRDLDQWSVYIDQQHTRTIDMGLARMHQMVERMQLSRPAPIVMTVAGTNGKGSTCVLCEALLQRNGVRVGTTLSPHIERINERIRIDGQPISDTLFCQAFTAVEQARDQLPLTYFEFVALAALWCFRHEAVDVAILEIGLGGRLDAFNAVDADIAVITSIGLDHQEYLGDNREQIGLEKAGILRAGQYVVLGADMPSSVLGVCRELQVDEHRFGRDFSLETNAHQVCWRQGSRTEQWAPARLPDHNLALALVAVQPALGEPIKGVADVAGRTTMPGRLQELAYHGRRLWLDVGHNPAAVEFLMQQLEIRRLQPSLIVCGMLQGKDHPGVIDVVLKHFDCPWLVLDTQGFRAMSGEALLTLLQSRNVTAQHACKGDSIHSIVDSATSSGDDILVFGSFSVVAFMTNEAKEADVQIPSTMGQ